MRSSQRHPEDTSPGLQKTQVSGLILMMDSRNCARWPLSYGGVAHIVQNIWFHKLKSLDFS